MFNNNTIAIVGLGYVGAPLALALSEHKQVIGFDICVERVQELQRGEDRTLELNPEKLAKAHWTLSHDSKDLAQADVIIVTVPTPVGEGNVPDMSCLIAASRSVGAEMKKGAIVVYESTVFPGATEEICLQHLNAASPLNYPADFAIGYSPERINPGDKVHRLDNTTKIVSGDRPEVLALLAELYGKLTAVHQASSIKVAEAAKILENTQRDVNIGLVNQMYQILSRMGVNTHHVLEAAGTKWNFHKYVPGLVGGHCISVDPHYMAHKAACEGTVAHVINSARQANDAMAPFLIDRLVKKMVMTGGIHRDSVVTIMGATFKEDVPDIRNSKVADLVKELARFGLNAQVVDPLADADEVEHELGVKLVTMEQALKKRANAVILAVGHQEFMADGGWGLVSKLAVEENAVVLDFKAQLTEKDVPANVTLMQ